MKAVTQVSSAIEATARNALEINFEKAAAEAINKMKQATRDGGNRATIETGDRKAEIKRDVRLVGAGARSRSRVDKEWKLQHPENGDGKAIRHNKDRSQDNVKNHCGRP